MSAAARGAGSRLEHKNSTAEIAPVVGECELLHCIRCHVDLRVLANTAARGQKLTNIFATLIVTLCMQISDVLFSFLRHISEEEALQ